MIYGAGTVATRVIGLLLLPLFTAYLQPAEYGILAMLGVLTMIAQPIFALGITAAMGPAYFETPREDARSQTIWTAFAIMAGSSVILLLCGWLIPERLGRWILLPAEHAGLVSLTLTGCALTTLATPFVQWAQFEERARRFVAVSVLSSLAATAASVFLVVALGWGARGMVLAQLLGNGLTLAALLGFALRETRPALNAGKARELLRLGLPMVPSVLLLFVLLHGNKYFLQWQEGLDQLGIYAVGFNLGTVISLVVSSISTSWYPFFMSFAQRRAEAEVLFGRIFSYYVFGVGYLALLFFVCARPVVMTMAQPRYWEAHQVIGLVSLAHFFTGVFNLLLPGLYFAKETARITAIQAASAVIALPLNYALVSAFGLLGAAIAVAAAHAVMAALTHGWNLHRSATYPRIKYEWRRLRGFVLGAGAIAALAMFGKLGSLAVESLKSALLGLAATGLVYACLNQDEKNSLRARLGIGARSAAP